MADLRIKRLKKASDIATNENLQHILFILTPDGQIELSGCDNFVDSICENTDLYDNIKSTLFENRKQGEEGISLVQVIHYSLLPFPPPSPA